MRTLTVLLTTLVLACALAPATTGAAPSAVVVVGDGPTHAPRAPLAFSSSTNWAGYAVETNLASPASNAVSDVAGDWTVPAVTCTGLTAYSAFWVGIDGYSSGSVEQTGTESDCTNGGTTPYYAAWYEMYPKPSKRLSMVLHPGDKMHADVSYTGGKYVLTIQDLTTGQSFSTSQSANAARSSAEWVAEAPSSTGGVLPLADFGTMTFSNGQATLNGHTGAIGDSAWQHDAITMVNSKGQVKCSVGGLSGGNSFSATWKQAQ